MSNGLAIAIYDLLWSRHRVLSRYSLTITYVVKSNTPNQQKQHHNIEPQLIVIKPLLFSTYLLTA